MQGHSIPPEASAQKRPLVVVCRLGDLNGIDIMLIVVVCRLGDLNGIDIMLQYVAAYKGRDPQSAEEEEFMQVRFVELGERVQRYSCRGLLFWELACDYVLRMVLY